jgi:hypothetical protein
MPEDKIHRFDPFTLDELHTLATALGNATKAIIKQGKEHNESLHGLQGYLSHCAVDNEELLKEILPVMRRKVVQQDRI